MKLMRLVLMTLTILFLTSGNGYSYEQEEAEKLIEVNQPPVPITYYRPQYAATRILQPHTPTPIPTSTPAPVPTPTLASITVNANESAEVTKGFFSYYGKSPTDGTIDWRIEAGQIDPDDLATTAGVIALSGCDLTGETVWVRVYGRANDGWIPVTVFDCAGSEDTRQWMEKGKILGEFGYYLTEWLGVNGMAPSQIPGEITFECPYCELE